MIYYMIKTREKHMTGTAWMDSKEVLEVVVEWMILLVKCLVEVPEVVGKSKSKE